MGHVKLKGAFEHAQNAQHYENIPIQIYYKFYNQTMKFFR